MVASFKTKAPAEEIPGGLSARGWSNVESIMPKIRSQVEQRKIPNNTNIDLSTAENWLVRDELIEICKESISGNLEGFHLSYPKGFSGAPDLLSAFSHLFNTYFSPHTPVKPDQIAATPGAASAVDSLLFNICQPGDGILVPGPYWNGFDFIFRVRSSVTPVLVTLPTFDSNFDSVMLINALEETFQKSEVAIKGLMLTNPHNPLGVCYPRRVLEECVRWCAKKGIHFISDEVYALTRFESPDIETPQEFVSVLELDLNELGLGEDERKRVHMVWSVSKDFGSSGLRMGCAVTQHNPEMAVGLALAANTQISALSAIFTTALLTSDKLPELMKLNSERLTNAYVKITSFLKRNNIAYVPANTGLWVMARVALSWEEEAEIAGKLKDAGVLVSSGRGYHGPESEAGWVRLGFSIGEDDLDEAIRRMESVFVKNNGVSVRANGDGESELTKKRREIKKRRRVYGSRRRAAKATAAA